MKTDLHHLLACWHCGKLIRGAAKLIGPVRCIPGDFAKAYHPECYAEQEKKAEVELRKQN